MSESMTKSVTYQQYRDAAYRYNGAAQKMRKDRKELENAQAEYNEKKEQLKQISESIDKNREERSRVYEEAIADHRAEWAEQSEKINTEIDEEIEDIAQRAKARIRMIQKEYLEESFQLDRKLRPYYNRVTQYEEELKTLYEKQSNIGDYSRQIPVANKKVLAFLKRAKNKRLLTVAQSELMNSPCDRFFKGRKNFTMFDDVKKAEKKFAESEWYKRLEKGDVTESVRRKAADVMSGGITAILLICFVLLFLANMTKAGRVMQVIVMMIALGGFTANIVSFVFVKMFFDDRSVFWKNNAKLISVAAGMFAGMGLWLAMYRSSVNIGPAVILLSLCSTFFLFRKSIVAFVGLDTLGKMEFMRDFSRKEIFGEKTGGVDNPYFLQMYCYFNHNAVIDYMAMNYRDNIYSAMEEKIEIARNCLNVANRDLAKHREELKELREMKNRRNRRILEVKEERRLAVAKAESRRPTKMPDFENMLNDDVKSVLERLDGEYDGLAEQRDELISLCRKTDDLVLKQKIRSSASQKKLDEFKNILGSWDSTPTPVMTEYDLGELFCFESDKNISIIKHNLEPFVFWYHSKDETRSPAKELNKAICKCIKGLKKINPQALMQINIVDTISPPEDILDYYGYKELSDDGLLTYVKTTDRFELRLIGSRKSYKPVRALFNSQCYDIRDFFDDNKEIITKDTELSLAGANRLKNDEEEPFVYQVMMYVVPRKYDVCDLEPPKELIRAMKDDVCASMGIIPFFFADKDSVNESWRELVGLCPWSCTLGRKKK